MALIFFLLFIASLCLLIRGLFRPDKVFLGPDASRAKAAQVYSAGLLIFLIAFIAAIPKDSDNSTDTENVAQQDAAISTSKPAEKSKFDLLVEQKKIFLPGDYAQGSIPKGEYIFISDRGGYYGEERDGQIIDNANFESFGYVYNHAIGDIKSHGLLVSQEALKELGFAGAKAIYELITKQTDYNFSGHYKVGTDIPAGRYIIESAGQGYVEINKGPVGKGEILNNDNFNGSKSINLRNGQYLQLTRASISTQNESVNKKPSKADAATEEVDEIVTSE